MRQILLAVLCGSLMSSFAAGQTEDMQQWGNRIAKGGGTLLNPPRSGGSPASRQTSRYIKGIIEKLAGDRLRREGIQVVVTILANEIPNAYVSQHPAPAQSSQGIASSFPLTKNITAAYGLNNDVVYEIGIHTGLLELLSNEGEVAFVLAHELTHLFEGHTDAFESQSDTAKQWYDAQAHEVIADQLGIQMMLGHYNLDAAISALHKLSIGSTAVDPFFAAKGSHHHEGVRIGSAQTYVEYLRRKNALAQISTDSPLPDFTKALRFVRRSNRATFEQLKRKFFQEFEELVVNPKLLENYMDYKNDSATDFYQSLLKATEINPEWNIELLSEATKELSLKNMTKQEKLDASLTLQIRLTCGIAVNSNSDMWEKANSEYIYQIERFMLENTVGNDGWRSERFLARIQGHLSDPGKKEIFLYWWRFTLLAGRRAQLIPAHLARLSPVWRDIIDQTIRHSFDPDEVVSLGYFGSMLATGVSDRGPWDGLLLPYIKEMFIAELSQMDWRLVTQGVCTFGPDNGAFLFPIIIKSFHDFSLKYKIDQDFVRAVDGLFEKHVQDFVLFRDQYVKSGITKDHLQNVQDMNFLVSFFETLRDYPAAEDVTAITKEALVRFSDKNLNENFVSFNNLDASPKFLSMISSILNSARFSVAQKRNVVRNLLAISALQRSKDVMSDAQQDLSALRDYLAALSLKEVIALMKEPIPTIENELVANHTQSPDQKGVGRYGAFAAKANARLSLLNYLGSERFGNSQIFQKFNARDLNQIIELFQDTRKLAKEADIGEFSKAIFISKDAATLLIRTLIQSESSYPTAASWLWTYEAIAKMTPLEIDDRELKAKLSAQLSSRLRNESKGNLSIYLRRKSSLDILSTEQASYYIRQILLAKTTGSSTASLANKTREVLKDLQLKDRYPDVYQAVREKWIEDQNIQPAQILHVDPVDQRTVTDQVQSFSGYVRALSGLVALVRTGSAGEQIQAIEYLMGLLPDIPDFMIKAKLSIAGMNGANYIAAQLSQLRSRLSREDQLTRAFVVNTFLAGPGSIVSKTESKNFMISSLLKEVRPENQGLAKVIATAVLKAQGMSASLAFAYVMAQPLTTGCRISS